jgi:4-amino-4-deoxy-L-arabinose transferase-like glycosyltransferase
LAGLCPRRYRAFAGLFAGGVFALIHVREGLIETGQRDLLLAALLVGAYVLLFRSLRQADWKASEGVGVLLGAACTVKPMAALMLPAVLLILVAALRERQQSSFPQALAVLAGAALAPGAALLFLLHWHAVGAFVVAMRSLAPLHASILRLPAGTLLQRSVSSVMLPLLLLWLPVCWARRGWRSWEERALWVGFLFGVLSFCLQGRGYSYHRYPSVVILLVMMARDFTGALAKETGRKRWVAALAAVGLGYGVLVVAPVSLWKAAHYTCKRDGFYAELAPELRRGSARR